MEQVREAWTDERLDDLNDRVAEAARRMDEGFSRIHEDLLALRTEFDTKLELLRTEIKGEIGSVRGEIGSVRGEIGSVRGEMGSVRGEIGSVAVELRGEIAALHRLILQAGGGIVATMMVGFLGIIATQL